MNGGNILTLQKVLGHTTLAMTMRHTHLAPNHLLDAIRLRPASDQQRFLAIITSSGECFPVPVAWLKMHITYIRCRYSQDTR